MKKILFLLFLIPIAGFSQNNNTDVQIDTVYWNGNAKVNEVFNREGERYLGNAVYEIVRVQDRKPNSLLNKKSGKEKKLLEEATNKAEDLTVQFGASGYKVISKDFSKPVYIPADTTGNLSFKVPAFLELKIQLVYK